MSTSARNHAASHHATSHHAAQAHTASGINILLGIWLLLSPWAFGYYAAGVPALLNSVVVGALIAMLAARRIDSWHTRAYLSWINVLLGLWTVASPWVYKYSANAGGVRDNVILGVVIATMAVWSGGSTIAREKPLPGAPVR